MFVLFLISFIFIVPKLTEASLTPEEIVVLVNANPPDSIRIDELYIKLRKVPSTHLIEVSVPMKEHISHEEYEELIAKPVRRAVNELKPAFLLKNPPSPPR